LPAQYPSIGIPIPENMRKSTGRTVVQIMSMPWRLEDCDVYVGTMFIEVDTGDVYVFMGGTTWTKKMEAIWD